jgi:hypothetical protein
VILHEKSANFQDHAPSSLPKGKPVYGGSEPQPGDEQIGEWSPKRLEPISKLFEEDNKAGKLNKAKEIVGVVLPANEDPALPLNPGEEALDEPASHVAA